MTLAGCDPAFTFQDCLRQAVTSLGFWWNKQNCANSFFERPKSKELMGTLDFWCEEQIYIERVINKENNKRVGQAGVVSLDRRQEQGKLLDHFNSPAWLIIDKAQWSEVVDGETELQKVLLMRIKSLFDRKAAKDLMWFLSFADSDGWTRRVKCWGSRWGSFQSLQVCCTFPVLCRHRRRRCRPLISYIINAALTLSQPCGDMKARAIN